MSKLKVDLAQRATGHQLFALRLRPLDKDDFGSSGRFARPTFGFLDAGKEALVSAALPLLDGPADGLNPSALAHVLREVQRQGVMHTAAEETQKRSRGLSSIDSELICSTMSACSRQTLMRRI